ncbi:hypothetical protein DFJ73DRAFT_781834 [Zopfochytrium polystomum]|nr:hypothetical protein DFJ73DRAFT_781834 [Zopfochytrium polystomum]
MAKAKHRISSANLQLQSSNAAQQGTFKVLGFRPANDGPQFVQEGSRPSSSVGSVPALAQPGTFGVTSVRSVGMARHASEGEAALLLEPSLRSEEERSSRSFKVISVIKCTPDNPTPNPPHRSLSPSFSPNPMPLADGSLWPAPGGATADTTARKRHSHMPTSSSGAGSGSAEPTLPATLRNHRSHNNMLEPPHGGGSSPSLLLQHSRAPPTRALSMDPTLVVGDSAVSSSTSSTAALRPVSASASAPEGGGGGGGGGKAAAPATDAAAIDAELASLRREIMNDLLGRHKLSRKIHRSSDEARGSRVRIEDSRQDLAEGKLAPVFNDPSVLSLSAAAERGGSGGGGGGGDVGGSGAVGADGESTTVVTLTRGRRAVGLAAGRGGGRSAAEGAGEAAAATASTLDRAGRVRRIVGQDDGDRSD